MLPGGSLLVTTELQPRRRVLKPASNADDAVRVDEQPQNKMSMMQRSAIALLRNPTALRRPAAQSLVAHLQGVYGISKIDDSSLNMSLLQLAHLFQVEACIMLHPLVQSNHTFPADVRIPSRPLR